MNRQAGARAQTQEEGNPGSCGVCVCVTPLERTMLALLQSGIPVFHKGKKRQGGGKWGG